MINFMNKQRVYYPQGWKAGPSRCIPCSAGVSGAPAGSEQCGGRRFSPMGMMFGA